MSNMIDGGRLKTKTLILIRARRMDPTIIVITLTISNRNIITLNRGIQRGWRFRSGHLVRPLSDSIEQTLKESDNRRRPCGAIPVGGVQVCKS